VARVRVDHRAAALVHLACGDREVARGAAVRALAERICARVLDRVAGELTPEAGARWARGDPGCARWVMDAALALGTPLYVRHAARSELLQGRVEARADPDGRAGALIAVCTPAPPERANALCGEVCRRLLAGESPGRASLRLRGLGPGTELHGSCRFVVGT